jgi:ketosteroid isomerase-like protein
MKNSILLPLVFLLITSCSEKNKEEENEQDIMNNILTTYNEMYISYGEGTDDFFEYFEDDFIRVTSSGDLQRGVEKQKIEWTDYLKTYSVDLKSFSKPEIIISGKQAMTIGDYQEFFINRETSDSIYNRGVYIASWRKQEDGSWKISMDTWHSGLDKE